MGLRPLLTGFLNRPGHTTPQAVAGRDPIPYDELRFGYLRNYAHVTSLQSSVLMSEFDGI